MSLLIHIRWVIVGLFTSSFIFKIDIFPNVTMYGYEIAYFVFTGVPHEFKELLVWLCSILPNISFVLLNIFWKNKKPKIFMACAIGSLLSIFWLIFALKNIVSNGNLMVGTWVWALSSIFLLEFIY